MRMLNGETFIDTPAYPYVPGDDELQEMRDDLDRDGPYPVFSEGHLYPRLGKEDARFVLGVAEEYEHLIKLLGPTLVRTLLKIEPRPNVRVTFNVTQVLGDDREEDT